MRCEVESSAESTDKSSFSNGEIGYDRNALGGEEHGMQGALILRLEVVFIASVRAPHVLPRLALNVVFV